MGLHLFVVQNESCIYNKIISSSIFLTFMLHIPQGITSLDHTTVGCDAGFLDGEHVHPERELAEVRCAHRCPTSVVGCDAGC